MIARLGAWLEKLLEWFVIVQMVALTLVVVTAVLFRGAIPGVRPLGREQLCDVIEQRLVRDERVVVILTAAAADDSRHRDTPGALSRDAPVGTSLDHLRDPLFAKPGCPLGGVNLFQSILP